MAEQIKPDNKGAQSGIQTGLKIVKALVLRCINGTKKKVHRFILGLHTTVFQTEIQPKGMHNGLQRATKVERSIFSLIVKVAIKGLKNFQKNSKLVWDCHQPLVKLVGHKTVQPILLPGHTGIDGYEIADQLATEGSSYPLTEPQPEPALGILVNVAKGVIRDWKHGEKWQSILGQRQSKIFLKKHSAKKLANCSV